MPRQQISKLAFLLAGLLIAVTSVSLLFVGYIASNASDRQAIQNERRLFQNTLIDRERMIVLEQLTIARWDESVRNIVLNFNYEFVRDKFGAMWTDYHHGKVLLVAGGNRVLAESFEDYTHFTNRSLQETPSFIPLVEKARALYHSNRVRIPGGYSHRTLQGLEPTRYAAFGFAVVDGKPAMIGAMPVIPDKETVTLPAGDPVIMVSVKTINAELLADLNAQSSFANLKFQEIVTADKNSPVHLVQDVAGQAIGGFVWQSQTQGTSIWPTVIPVILVLSLLLAALAFGIAWRIGRLTGSLHASERQNHYLAHHDTLSGLSNRLQFSRVLAKSVRHLPEKPFAVIHCDLDEFKTVNDTYGHAAGDEVVKAVAARMLDVVGQNGLVSRIGGDEFVILFHAFVDRGRLTLLSGKLISAVAAPIPIGGNRVAYVGLSLGIAAAPDCGDNEKSLMAAADAALYFSKENGRRQTTFSSDLSLVECSKNTVEPAEDESDAA